MKKHLAPLPAIVSAPDLPGLISVQGAYAAASGEGAPEADFFILRSKQGDFSAYFHPAGSPASFGAALELALAQRYFFPTSIPLIETLKKDFDATFHAELAEFVPLIVADEFSKGKLLFTAPEPAAQSKRALKR